jgi:hypothetical protein
MSREHWWKIGGTVIMFLLSLAIWFAQSELTDMKASNKSQWQLVQKLSERMAHLEGFHEAERCYQPTKKEGK